MKEEKREEFRRLCAKAGFRKDYQIAKALGISPETLSRKLNGKSDFTLPEINRIRVAFSISERQAAELFL